MSRNAREEEEERRKRQTNMNRPTNDVVTDGAAGGQVNLANFQVLLPSPTPMATERKKMKSVAERMETFKSYIGNNTAALAGAGFYLQENGVLKCDYCQLTVPLTEDLSEPRQLHFAMAPSCEFLNALLSQHAPKTTTAPRAALPGSPAAAASPYEARKGPADPRTTAPYPMKYPDYDTVDKRAKSFTGWPITVVGQDPKVLAVCGFYYIGSADRVRCFSCGTTLRNWEPHDDPFKEHQTWAPSCQFIKMLRPETVPQPSTAPEENKPAPAPEEKKPASAPAPAPAPEPAKVPPTTMTHGNAITVPAAGSSTAVNRLLTGGSFGNTSTGTVPAPRVAVLNSDSSAVTSTTNTAGNTRRVQEVPTAAAPPSAAQQVATPREEDVMASPQVKAVLEMGVAEAAIRAVVNARKAQGLGQFDSAVDLFIAAESFTPVQ